MQGLLSLRHLGTSCTFNGGETREREETAGVMTSMLRSPAYGPQGLQMYKSGPVLGHFCHRNADRFISLDK